MPKSILDPTFRYTNAVNTDIRKTIAKEKKRLKDLADHLKAQEARDAGGEGARSSGSVVRLRRTEK